MSVYRLSSPYERQPLQRRASGLALAFAVNLALLFALLTLGQFAPEDKSASHALIVDLLPESHSVSNQSKDEPRQTLDQPKPRQALKPPPIVLPAKPTIRKAPAWIEMSSAEMASSDLRNSADPSGSSRGDSQIVGKGPHGETLYAAEWARHPTDAELGGYMPHNAPDGYGLIACKTAPEERVEDCVELGQTPGSHLASAVRQAAWQFRVRPPRKNGVPLIGEWVEIRIDYENIDRGSAL